jgi:hypothetical protein
MDVGDMTTDTSRRRFIRSTVGAAGVAGLSATSGCISLFFPPPSVRGPTVGAGSLGSKEYPAMQFASQQHRVTKKMATHVVNNRSQLIDAVGTPEAIIWIPENVTIDMTDTFGIIVAPNVTIASNRLLDSKTGGMIKSESYDEGIFINDKGGFRITGVRLRGPRMDYFDPWNWGADEEDYSALAFKLQGQTAIVDNCEVFGWPFAGFALGARGTQTSGWIHHNSMHHNQMNHLGYPMELYNGLHLIEWNYFDRNRHSIAGFGYPTNGYEARFNVVGPHSIQHAFDMHYLGENLDNNNMVAGRFANVHHNVFELTSNSAFSIQGYPLLYARFSQNWCAAPKEGAERGDPEGVVFFLNGADVRVKNNTYGQETIKPGRQWLRKMQLQLTQNIRAGTGPPRPEPSAMNIKRITSNNKQSDTVDPLTGAALSSGDQ